jgi:hypothetical protein
MIEYLIEQLGREFKVIRDMENGRNMIEIYSVDNGWVDQETFLRLTRTNHDMWDLAEVQRGQAYSKAQFLHRDVSYCAAYLAAKSSWDYEFELQEAKPDWSGVGESLSEAQKLMEQHIAPKYFSLYREEKGAINLEKANDTYNVYYLSLTDERTTIVEQRDTPNVFIVIYNYAILLQKFDLVIAPWEEKLTLDVADREKLKRVYLGI